LTLTQSLADSDVLYYRAYGNDTDDAVAPTSTADAEGKAKTTNFVNKVITGSGVDGTEHQWDVVDIVQEIVDRAGWSSGNAMMFLLEDYDSSSTGSPERKVYSYEDDTQKCGRLNITYS